MIWKTPFEGGVGLTPAKLGEYLVITTSNDPFYVIRAKDGKIVTRLTLGSGTLGSALTATEGWFYVLSNFGNLFSFQLVKSPIKLFSSQVVERESAILREANKSNSDRERS